MRWAGRLERRALVGDGVLALVLAGIGVATSVGPWTWQGRAHHIDVLGVALIVGAALPLAARRTWPLATMMLTVAATSAYLVLGYPYGLFLLSVVVAVYTVAARLPAGRATLAGVVALAALLAHVLVRAAGPGGTGALVGLAPGAAWVVLPFAVGRVVRVDRDSAARTRTEEVRRHSYEERLRIAQEVHDVVGHGLTAIHMQAEIALHVLSKRPEQAETALAAVPLAIFALPAIIGQAVAAQSAGSPGLDAPTANNLVIAPTVAVAIYTAMVAISVLKPWGRIRH